MTDITEVDFAISYAVEDAEVAEIIYLFQNLIMRYHSNLILLQNSLWILPMSIGNKCKVG